MSCSTYTCITCRVAFLDADLQRAHYKTDWHRYNLKRKVAELPPVTAENFQERVLAQRAQLAEEDRPTPGYCHYCQKRFSTQNAYDNHLSSKKHKELEAKQREVVEAQVRKKNEKNKEKGLAVQVENLKLTEKNLKNLAIKNRLGDAEGAGGAPGGSGDKLKQRSGKAELFDEDDIETDSEEEEVSDFEGEALGLEECLFCSHISDTMEDNIKHMTTAHSFFLPDVEYVADLEGLIGYLGEKVGVGNVCLWCNEKGRAFLTVKSVQQHMIDKGHCKISFDMDNALEYADFYDYRSSYPDYKEGEEPMEGDDDGGQEDQDEIRQKVLDSQNYELVLPSGSSVGHRSLMKYYRQNLPLRNGKRSTVISKVMAHYRGLGWTGTIGPGAEKKAKDLAYVQRMKHKHHMKIGVKANKLQKHFREQVLF
ncbi:cytoplasmic 60S subunit biogenesis factor ZNF622-like [Lineus longissimus]|uniref:cytoplasmic 60S subunit biogenesis factor ZNF622-like n=1 Tax=Lineus longissimus TaxID=88925 RepID=UPI00315CAD2D